VPRLCPAGTRTTSARTVLTRRQTVLHHKDARTISARRSIHLMLPNARIIDARLRADGPALQDTSAASAQRPGVHLPHRGIAALYAAFLRAHAHGMGCFAARASVRACTRRVEDLEGSVTAACWRFCGLELAAVTSPSRRQPAASVRAASSSRWARRVYRDGLEEWQHFEPWSGRSKGRDRRCNERYRRRRADENGSNEAQQLAAIAALVSAGASRGAQRRRRRGAHAAASGIFWKIERSAS